MHGTATHSFLSWKAQTIKGEISNPTMPPTKEAICATAGNINARTPASGPMLTANTSAATTPPAMLRQTNKTRRIIIDIGKNTPKAHSLASYNFCRRTHSTPHEHHLPELLFHPCSANTLAHKATRDP